jgi:hypothetical protein
MERAMQFIGNLRRAAVKADNIPYTVLGILAFVSLASRMILILK